MQDTIAKLREKEAAALLGGGEHRIQQQHLKGKLPARERIEHTVVEGDTWGQLARRYGAAARRVPSA